MPYEFRCRDVGVVCRASHKADNPEELVRKVRAHAERRHGVTLNQTLVDYAVSTARQTGSRTGQRGSR